MNACHRFKFIFLAVPRTGSRITFKTLQAFDLKGGAPNGGMTHEMAVPAGCESYTALATIRSPFTRWVSCWVWCKRWPVVRGSHYEQFAIWLRDNPNDFPGFVERAVAKGYIRTVSSYLTRVQAERWCLMRYESLNADFAKAAKRLGLPSDELKRIPLVHNRETLQWRRYYDQRATDLVRQHSMADFVKYGYSEDINDHLEIE